jgi:hypothetical protein
MITSKAQHEGCDDVTQHSKHQVALDDVLDFIGEDEDQPVVEVPAAEDMAVHAIPGVPRLGVRDPGRGESAVGYEPDEDELPVSWFDDEEHEGEPTPGDIADLDTADVEDVLIAQHYAFETESEKDDDAENDDAQNEDREQVPDAEA